ncbi:lytic transglycosylase domain-containing protein [Dyella sp. BiH032]|uniref:lytic transglycosylase domain-containing protein n=1 Tax=Dyella sp. BiH032 TaxID=3075430 RepID=UPI00289371F0|nr:lytic transglycosylase domain-containing protein [Dyella sp. BiH032]WNL45266.1 lytic transglycosylase domain-containing protein [Dyella sp. BiH032]
MSDAERQGESIGSSSRAFRPGLALGRAAFACLFLGGSLWLAPVHAGGLYRCMGSAGETVYSNSMQGYQGCQKIANVADVAPRAKARVPVPPAASLAWVKGGAQTTAQVLPEPSLIGVHGDVATSGKPLPPVVAPVAAGKAGQWTYSESKAATDSVAAAPPPPPAGDRVLRGAVYRVTRPDGSVEYTNMKPAGQGTHAVTMLFTYISTCVACNLHSPIRWDSVQLNLTAYADTIRLASAEFGLDEAFLRAIIHAESAYNPRALSIAGAQGLMQLMPSTANDMGVRDAFDVDQNIRGGARYLALLLKNFNGDERLAAAAYNAGPGAVQRYSGVPPYAETQVYVERVGTLRKRYGAVTRPPVASAQGSGPGRG